MPTFRSPVRRVTVAALAIAALLGACAGELGTPTEALRLLTADLPDAVVNEPYDAPLLATGGLRPYEFTLEDGRLPAGISLVNGNLQGTPTQLGESTFTLRVSDANLSQFTNEYRLRVVELPPTALTLRVPETEVRSAVTLRARVTEARSLLGLRTVIAWDPAAYTLRAGSVAATRRGLALFHHSEPGMLQVDVAVLAGQGPGATSEIDGAADLFNFVLEPLQAPGQIAVSVRTEFVSAGSDALRRELAEVVEGGPAARLALTRVAGLPSGAGSAEEPPDEPGGEQQPPGPEQPPGDPDEPGEDDPDEPDEEDPEGGA